MCNLLNEPAVTFFMAGLQATEQIYIGAATRAETWLATFNAKGKAGAQQIEALLGALQVESVVFTQAASRIILIAPSTTTIRSTPRPG